MIYLYITIMFIGLVFFIISWSRLRRLDYRIIGSTISLFLLFFVFSLSMGEGVINSIIPGLMGGVGFTIAELLRRIILKINYDKKI